MQSSPWRTTHFDSPPRGRQDWPAGQPVFSQLGMQIATSSLDERTQFSSSRQPDDARGTAGSQRGPQTEYTQKSSSAQAVSSTGVKAEHDSPRERFPTGMHVLMAGAVVASFITRHTDPEPQSSSRLQLLLLHCLARAALDQTHPVPGGHSASRSHERTPGVVPSALESSVAASTRSRSTLPAVSLRRETGTEAGFAATDDVSPLASLTGRTRWRNRPRPTVQRTMKARDAAGLGEINSHH